MNIINFTLFNNWDQNEQFLKVRETGQKFTKITEKEMRYKALGLAFTTPLVHLALSVANIAYRSLRIISFYHFWKPQDGSYDFKARLLDTGKDALKAAIQPIAFLALEISAIYGLFRPYDGMKLFNNIEQLQYDRLILMKLFQIGALESKETHTSSSSTTDSIPNDSLKTTPRALPVEPVIEEIEVELITEIPNFENTINETIKSFNNSSKAAGWLKAQLIDHLATAIMDALLDVYTGAMFEKYATIIADQLKSHCLNPKNKPTEKEVAAKIVNILIDANEFEKISTIAGLEIFKEPIVDHLNKQVGIIQNDPVQFKDKYESLLVLLNSLPKGIQTNIDLSPIQNAIKDVYVKHFENLLKQLVQCPLNIELSENSELMNQLLALVDNEKIIDQTKVAIFTKKLTQAQVLNLMRSKMHTPLYSAVGHAGLVAERFNINDEKTLVGFVELIGSIYQHLNAHDVDDENDLYLGYFLAYLTGQIEAAAIAIKPLLDRAEFDHRDPEQSQLAQNIQGAVSYIKEKLGMDLELKVEMKTQNDELIALLATALNADNNDAITKWVESNEQYDFAGFQAWLGKDQMASSIPVLYPNVDPTPESIYALYVVQ